MQVRHDACQVSSSSALAAKEWGSARVAPSNRTFRGERRISAIPCTYSAWSPVCIVRFTAVNEALRSFWEPQTMASTTVRDNKAQSRFELDVEGAVAFANYRLAPSRVIITHTETPRALRGRGIASELVKGALELIRADGLKVVAGCGFVVDYLQKHPEFSDLMA